MARTHARIGVIGLGDTLPDAGLASLQAQARLKIVGVWSESADTTDRVAHLLRTHPTRSMNGLLARDDVEGVVILNPTWTGWHCFHFASLHRKPALLLSSRMADRLYFHSLTVSRLVQEARSANVLLMPGLLLRWLPATIRLRELMATSLGAIETLKVEGATLSVHSRYLADLLDWCCNVVQSAPVAVSAVQAQEQHGLSDLTVTVAFRRRRADGGPVQATILLKLGLSPNEGGPHLTALAECRRGRLKIDGDRELEWSQEQRSHPEKLTADRSEVDVALDLFGRRVVGGVVPVPDLGDVERSLGLVECTVRSLKEGREIPVT